MSEPLTAEERHNFQLESPGYPQVDAAFHNVVKRYEATIAAEVANEREAIKAIVTDEKGMHEFLKSPIGVAVCNSILSVIECERE